MKNRIFCAIAICLTAACMGGGGSGGSGGSGVDRVQASLTAIDNSPDRSFDALLNSVRSVYGSGNVSYDARLGVAAQAHADDMLANNFFAHQGSDGSGAGQRIRRAGYNWRAWGENIAKGQQSEEAALRGWVNSPGHQSNNVNPNFEDFALARAGAGRDLYWVLVLAAER
jgi:uncharacterized protein YkwD